MTHPMFALPDGLLAWRPKHTSSAPAGPLVVHPLTPAELDAVERARARLDAAGRFDCIERIDRMSNAELRALADAEGLAFRPVVAGAFRDREALEVRVVDAARSEQQHQEVAEMDNAEPVAHPWAMAS